MLLENIEKRLNELMEKINNSENVSEELLATLESFSSNVLNDELSLTEVDNPNEYLDLVYSDDEEIEKYKKELSTLKMLVKMIKDHQNEVSEAARQVLSLKEDQKEFLIKVCNDTKKFIDKKKKENKENNERKEDAHIYQGLKDKIGNKETLNLEDFEVISTMIDQENNKDKFEIYKEFLTHNLGIGYEQEPEDKNKGITEEEANEILKNITEEPENSKKYQKVYDTYKEEILKNSNFEQAKEIINFLKEKNILDKFERETLLSVLTFATIDTVKEAYTELVEKDQLKYSFIYKYPGLWTFQKANANHISKEIKGGNGADGVKSLRDKTKILNRDKMYQKIEVLTKRGYSYDDITKNSSTLLELTLENIEETIDVLEEYGVDRTKPSGLKSEKKAAEKCDIAIESGMLDPTIMEYDTDDVTTYVNTHPSFLIRSNLNDKGHMLLMQTLLEDSVETDDVRKYKNWDDVFGYYRLDDPVKKNKNCFNGQFIEDCFGLKLNKDEEKYEEFKERYGMTEVSEELPQAEEMTDAIIPNLIKFSDETLNSSFIQELDSKYKMNNFIYFIDNKKISRYKVLRVYESLTKYNQNNPDKAFDESDIRLFAITYNSFMKKELFEKIKNEVNLNNESRRVK